MATGAATEARDALGLREEKLKELGPRIAALESRSDSFAADAKKLNGMDDVHYEEQSWMEVCCSCFCDMTVDDEYAPVPSPNPTPRITAEEFNQ